MAARSTKMGGHRDRKSWSSRTNPPLLSMGSPGGSDDERLDADTILVAELRGRSQQASETQVKSHLKQEAETVATKPENSLVYANVRGFGILESLEHLKQTVDSQARDFEIQKRGFEIQQREFEIQKRELEKLRRDSRSEIEGLQNEARESSNKISTQNLNLLSLEGRVTNLSLVSEGYLDIRMRFLDNYNKKVKHNPAFQKTSSIEIGNLRAHGGDAVVDATLFRDNKRLQDPETYEELYGVEHSKTLEYAEEKNDDRVFRVLNARATQIAQKRPFSDKLENAFKLYLASINKVGVAKAHSTFWKMYNKEYALAE